MTRNNPIEPLEPRLLLSSTTTHFTAPANPRVTINLDAGWKFKRADVSGASATSFNDSSWSSVNVPHTWNNLDGEDGGSNYYQGIGWYRRHFTPAASLAGKIFFIQFDGANLATDVYINGKAAGSHLGGYAGFVFNVTSLIKTGADNVLAVKVNNAGNKSAAPLSGDFTMDGGIYRDVSLIATRAGHISLTDNGSPGVFATASNVSATSASIAVKTDLVDDASTTRNLSIETDIVDAAGNIKASGTTTHSLSTKTSYSLVQNFKIANPHLWNGVKDPYEYTVYVIIRYGGQVTDEMSQSIGLRFFRVDPKLGFFLNGQPYDLHGVALYQDRLDKGFAISDADREQDISLIQEIGATSVRLAIYQEDQKTYDLLDRAGIIIWSDLPIIDWVYDSSGFISNAKQQLQELIRQNYNHPAIMFWGLFNEIADTTAAANVIPQLNTLAHSEDPTRLTTAATYPAISDWSKMNSYTDLIASNRYYGWYSGVPSDMGKWIDTFHSEHPSRPMGISEYGAGASIYQHEADPSNIVTTGTWHPEEYQSDIHEAIWPQLAARPFLWFKSVWNMFDFASDVRSEGDTPGRNDKGLVTYDRKTKKDAFYYYKANWSSSKFVYVTDRRWTDRTDANTDVKVYSNDAQVELFVNGESAGVVTAPNHVFVWHDIQLATGQNSVEAVPVGVTSQASDQVTWTLAAPLPPPPPQTDAIRTSSYSLQSSTLQDVIDGESKKDRIE